VPETLYRHSALKYTAEGGGGDNYAFYNHKNYSYCLSFGNM